MNPYQKRIGHQNQFNITVNLNALSKNITENNGKLNEDSGDWAFTNNEQTWTEYDQKELLEAEGNSDIDTSMFFFNETGKHSAEEMDYEIIN